MLNQGSIEVVGFQPWRSQGLTCQVPSCLIYTGPGLDHSSQVQIELLCGNSDGPQTPLTNRNGLEQIFLKRRYFIMKVSTV